MKISKFSSFLLIQYLLLSTTFLSTVLCAKILMIYPLASGSDINMVRPLAIELAQKRGHQVTFVTPKYSFINTGAYENITEISPLNGPTTTDYYPSLAGAKDILVHRKLYKNIFKWTFSFDLKSFHDKCHNVYENEEFITHVMDEKFDLLFIDGSLHECFMGLVHKFQVPWILTDPQPFTGDLFQGLGDPVNPALIPMSILPFTDQMEFSQRAMNFIIRLMYKVGYQTFVANPSEEIYRRYLGQNVPSLQEIQRSVSMVFSNSHFAVTFSRSFTPDVLEIGGIQCRQPKDEMLDGELKSFIEEYSGGFVFFSMGSMFTESSLPSHIRLAFEELFRALEMLNIGVLYKTEIEPNYEATGYGNFSKNVLARTWFPQQDILGHKNLQLFVTHGGVQSFLESAYHGVPLVVIPIWSDQGLSAAQVEKQKTGVMLEILELNSEKLQDAVFKVLKDKTYKANAQRLSSIFRHQQQTPLEKAVFWTEFILKHGAVKELRSQSRGMNSFSLYGLDVMLLLGFLIVLSIQAMLAVVKLAVKLYAKVY